MYEKIVLALVVVIFIAAHVYLYKWVKFKIDEGVILKFFQHSGDDKSHSSEAIAAQCSMSAHRVSAVCRKSNSIRKDDIQQELWSVTLPPGA